MHEHRPFPRSGRIDIDGTGVVGWIVRVICERARGDDLTRI